MVVLQGKKYAEIAKGHRHQWMKQFAQPGDKVILSNDVFDVKIIISKQDDFNKR